MRCSSSGRSLEGEGERGIAPDPWLDQGNALAPTGLARRLLWVHASEVVLGFVAFSVQQLSSDPVSSEEHS